MYVSQLCLFSVLIYSLFYCFLSFTTNIFSPFVIYFLAFLTTFFYTEDFNLQLLFTLLPLNFASCQIPTPRLQNSLIFSSDAFIGTFSFLIFDASRIYFSVRMEVWVQLNFIQNVISLSQYHLSSKQAFLSVSNLLGQKILSCLHFFLIKKHPLFLPKLAVLHCYRLPQFLSLKSH